MKIPFSKNFPNDLLTTKPPLSLNWKDLLFYQVDLLPNKSCHSLCTKSFPKINTTKLTVPRTNIIAFPFSIVIILSIGTSLGLFRQVNRNFARPFPNIARPFPSSRFITTWGKRLERCSNCVANRKNLMKNFFHVNFL